MAVSAKFAEPRSHAVQKVRNAAASDAAFPVVIQNAKLGRSAGSFDPRTRGRQESELPPAPMANLKLVNSSLKGVTRLPDLDQPRPLDVEVTRLRARAAPYKWQLEGHGMAPSLAGACGAVSFAPRVKKATL
jgi:hypothetical protein